MNRMLLLIVILIGVNVAIGCTPPEPIPVTYGDSSQMTNTVKTVYENRGDIKRLVYTGVVRMVTLDGGRVTFLFDDGLLIKVSGSGGTSPVQLNRLVRIYLSKYQEHPPLYSITKIELVEGNIEIK